MGSPRLNIRAKGLGAARNRVGDSAEQIGGYAFDGFDLIGSLVPLAGHVQIRRRYLWGAHPRRRQSSARRRNASSRSVVTSRTTSAWARCGSRPCRPLASIRTVGKFQTGNALAGQSALPLGLSENKRDRGQCS